MANCFVNEVLILLSSETKDIFLKNLRKNSLNITMCVYYRRGVRIRKNNTRHQKIRRRIQTTISQLSEQFSIGSIRARTHCGFRTRLSNKFTGFTLGVFLNKCLGRKLMALKDIVYAYSKI